jgi:hypothetical protein
MKTMRRGSYSAPHINRGIGKARFSIEFSQAQERARSESFQEAYDKLPEMHMKKVLSKMGIVSQT